MCPRVRNKLVISSTFSKYPMQMWVFFSSGLSDMGKVVLGRRVTLSAKLTPLPAPTALDHAPIVSPWPSWPRWVPLQSNREARLAEPTVQYSKWSPGCEWSPKWMASALVPTFVTNTRGKDCYAGYLYKWYLHQQATSAWKASEI